MTTQLSRNWPLLDDHHLTEIEHKKITIVGNDNEISKSLHKILNTKCILTTEYENKFDGIILNATSIETVEDTADFFKEAQRCASKLNKNARVLVLYKENKSSRETFAVQAAFEGFTRALSKELGIYGTTANHLKITDAQSATIASSISGAILSY